MAAASKVSLKLLIDTKTKRVLFAEAGKDFIDFLFTVLGLPVGTIVRLLKNQDMAGCLANLYESVETLSDDYLRKNLDKNSILNPGFTTPSPCPGFLLLEQTPASRKFYTCGYCNSSYYTDNPRATCSCCRNKMSREISYVAATVAAEEAAGEECVGYVKGVVTYMVMDNLVVKPMSTISGITLLNKFNVKDVGSLEEKVVDLDMAAGLKLLKESLVSNTVLTSAFLEG